MTQNQSNLTTCRGLSDSRNVTEAPYGRLYALCLGLVGYVSDVPLLGDTVEKELDSDKGEQKAVKVIIDHISHNAA